MVQNKNQIKSKSNHMLSNKSFLTNQITVRDSIMI